MRFLPLAASQGRSPDKNILEYVPVADYPTRFPTKAICSQLQRTTLMHGKTCSRRRFLNRVSAMTAVAASCPTGICRTASALAVDDSAGRHGSQRLPLEQLQKWESLGYGMFIHFGMSTFIQSELPDGKAPAMKYAPDRLDVDQWVSVARDAGMQYIVLTTKHVAGHCLWPSKHTDYTVANSADKTNVVEQFCKACEKRGVLAGLYYCSWDNHNRFGSRTRSDGAVPPFTTSLYQNFQTAQVTELLTQFGPIAETWIDIPGELGRGYRTFLYHHIAALQPQTVVMMNSGTPDVTNYDVAYAWPSDLIAVERGAPGDEVNWKWREIEGKKYYLPGEVCDPIGKEWFWVQDDKPRSDEVLLKQFNDCRAGGANFLLDVPPDTHGLIPDDSIATLMRLRKNVGI